MVRKVLIFCISLMAFLAAITPIGDDQAPLEPVPAYSEKITVTHVIQQSFWEELVRHNYETMEEREEEARE